MGGAATILFAREDLSIPGSVESEEPARNGSSGAETRFFNLLRDGKPDVVVLDLSNSGGNGVATILKIRQRSAVPILVVCDADHPAPDEYRIAGAADFIAAPLDIIRLNQTIQRIIQITRQAGPRTTAKAADSLFFAGLTFRPHQNELAGGDGQSTNLTTLENRLMLHLASNAWVLCTRTEIGAVLYGRDRPVSDRAIDVVVNRLRRKLTALGGPDSNKLIKTEFRRGYMLVTDVSAAADAEPPTAQVAYARTA
ncbi:MAG: response regulator transcription factor [Alphaproteobacteria bacterium]|nr:response regulator transcription factor [Alphaproteobacteria bacterium]